MRSDNETDTFEFKSTLRREIININSYGQQTAVITSTIMLSSMSKSIQKLHIEPQGV